MGSVNTFFFLVFAIFAKNTALRVIHAAYMQEITVLRKMQFYGLGF